MNIILGYDNSLCRDFIRENLTEQVPDMQITVASTVRDCMQHAAQMPQLSVVALDTEMADMDG